VHEQFQFDPDLNPAEIIRAVLRVMYRHMGEGELGDVKFNMLESIQEWFPEEPGHGNKNEHFKLDRVFRKIPFNLPARSRIQSLRSRRESNLFKSLQTFSRCSFFKKIISHKS
jgi:hypothetical protein